MNKLQYQFQYIPILLLSALVLIGCHNHDHGEDEHDHDDHAHNDSEDEANHNDHDDHEDSDAHGKIVVLNEAQYNNANIDTGWFDMKNLSDVVHANGYTKLDPQDQADVSLPIAGTISTIDVIEGNFVKKGQKLATMFSLEYDNKLLEQAKLKEDLSVAIAEKEFLQLEYNRQKVLVDELITAAKTLEKISSELAAKNARIIGVRKQIELYEKMLRRFKNSSSNHLIIQAPIEGYITDINLKIGASIPPHSVMFSIVDNSQMHVDLLVYEKDLPKVEVGQNVRFILTNQSNKEIKGTIYNIGKSFANETKSVAVHADIESNNANLIPGMYINALIDVDNNEVQTLPENAVVAAEGREFIFLWEKENVTHQTDEEHANEISFARIEVRSGAEQLGHVAVIPLEEIHDGDKIVINGAYYLQSHLQKAEGGGGHSH